MASVGASDGRYKRVTRTASGTQAVALTDNAEPQNYVRLIRI
jgi:hypothetical protein